MPPTTIQNVPLTSHRWTYDFDSGRQLGCIPMPRLKETGVYISGCLFAIGWVVFIDSIIYSNTSEWLDVSIRFEDWFNGVIATIGMIIVNSLDKSCLSEHEYLYTRSRLTLWKARLLLFIGFFMMACGVCGSTAILVYKYLIPGIRMPELYMGIAIVIQSWSIFLSSIVLWIAQNTGSLYKYTFIL